MSRLPTRLVVLAAIAAAFGFGAAFIVLQANKSPSPGAVVAPAPRLVREGQPAPDFSLETLDGKTVKLSDYRGQRVLVNFWASWCGPCIEETPDLVQAFNELKAARKDVVFLGVATQDSPDEVLKFTTARNVNYTIVLDPKGLISGAYGVFGLPATFFVDEGGTVRRIINGAVTRERVLAAYP